jgi:hypothetical protein
LVPPTRVLDGFSYKDSAGGAATAGDDEDDAMATEMTDVRSTDRRPRWC